MFAAFYDIYTQVLKFEGVSSLKNIMFVVLVVGQDPEQIGRDLMASAGSVRCLKFWQGHECVFFYCFEGKSLM